MSLPIIIGLGLITGAILYPKKYYHGSSKPLTIGKIIKSKKRPTEFSNRKSLDSINIENFIENNKPINENSRLNSIFLVDDYKKLNIAGASENYVYEVKPVGHISKGNFSWISELLSFSRENRIKNNKIAKKLVENYYTGEQNKNYPVKMPTEYLAKEIIVTKRIK